MKSVLSAANSWKLALSVSSSLLVRFVTLLFANILLHIVMDAKDHSMDAMTHLSHVLRANVQFARHVVHEGMWNAKIVTTSCAPCALTSASAV